MGQLPAHLTGKLRDRYARMLGTSTTVVDEQFVPPPSPMLDPCRFRGEMLPDQASIQACCGVRYHVDAWSCSKLKNRCILKGSPKDQSVAVCVGCAHYIPTDGTTDSTKRPISS